MKRQELLAYLRACEKQQIHPDFSGKDLTGTDFSGLHGRDGIRTMSGAIFRGAKVIRCDFSGTCLDHTDLTGADLTGSRLRRVKADFHETKEAGFPLPLFLRLRKSHPKRPVLAYSYRNKSTPGTKNKKRNFRRNKKRRKQR